MLVLCKVALVPHSVYLRGAYHSQADKEIIVPARNRSFLRTSHHVLAIGYLQLDGSPTGGKTLWRKQASLDLTDLGACVNQHVEDPFHFPAQG